MNPVTVNGVLKLERGFVAVQSDTADVYLVPLLNRYIGFINGLTEGARVTVEGAGFRNIIHPEKLTINGRTYDFPRPGQGHGPGTFYQNQRRENPRQNMGNPGQTRNPARDNNKDRQNKPGRITD